MYSLIHSVIKRYLTSISLNVHVQLLSAIDSGYEYVMLQIHHKAELQLETNILHDQLRFPSFRGGRGSQRFGTFPKFHRVFLLKASLINF